MFYATRMTRRRHHLILSTRETNGFPLATCGQFISVQVSNTLTRLEGVNNFTEFVKAFSQFGSEMVDFAHVTGDRQNDLKDERRRAQMSAARTILERSTLMLLTASKVNFFSMRSKSRPSFDVVHLSLCFLSKRPA